MNRSWLIGKTLKTVFTNLLEGAALVMLVLYIFLADLRAAGLSRAKVAALHDLSARCLDGRLRLGRLGTLSDEEVAERLVSVRGIGEWSAQMFLISALRRPDVWPCGDVGVRAGWGKAHRTEAPSVHQMPKLGEPFRPYRSLVAWYCWQSADTTLPG